MSLHEYFALLFRQGCGDRLEHITGSNAFLHRKTSELDRVKRLRRHLSAPPSRSSSWLRQLREDRVLYGGHDTVTPEEEAHFCALIWELGDRLIDYAARELAPRTRHFTKDLRGLGPVERCGILREIVFYCEEDDGRDIEASGPLYRRFLPRCFLGDSLAGAKRTGNRTCLGLAITMLGIARLCHLEPLLLTPTVPLACAERDLIDSLSATVQWMLLQAGMQTEEECRRELNAIRQGDGVAEAWEQFHAALLVPLGDRTFTLLDPWSNLVGFAPVTGADCVVAKVQEQGRLFPGAHVSIDYGVSFYRPAQKHIRDALALFRSQLAVEARRFHRLVRFKDDPHRLIDEMIAFIGLESLAEGFGHKDRVCASEIRRTLEQIFVDQVKSAGQPDCRIRLMEFCAYYPIETTMSAGEDLTHSLREAISMHPSAELSEAVFNVGLRVFRCAALGTKFENEAISWCGRVSSSQITLHDALAGGFHPGALARALQMRRRHPSVVAQLRALGLAEPGPLTLLENVRHGYRPSFRPRAGADRVVDWCAPYLSPARARGDAAANRRRRTIRAAAPVSG